MKKLVLVSIVVITCGLLLINISYKHFHKQKSIIQNEETKERELSGVNSLAIMLQGDDGNYKLSESDTWPGEGYVFNATLSKCENGGTLSWDNGKVTLRTSGSDKCYVYFDKIKPSSFTIENMDSDFYTHCSIQVSYDDGISWQEYQLSTNKGDITNFNEGTIIRVINKDSRYLYCSINICDGASNCPVASDKDIDSCKYFAATSGNNNSSYDRKDFTVPADKTYSYALTYCTCLTGENMIWVEEKKKRRKKKISELKKGDKILVIDKKSGKITTKKVKEIEVNKVNIICKITLVNGEVIRSSMRHIFVSENLGDVLAEELKVGYKLQDALGNYQEIKNIEIENYKEGIEVYTIIPEDSKSIKRIIISSLITTGAFGSNMMLAFAVAGCMRTD